MARDLLTMQCLPRAVMSTTIFGVFRNAIKICSTLCKTQQRFMMGM